MRKLIVSSLVSADGGFTSPASWVGDYFDADAAATALARLNESDAFLMGRASYEYFAPAWSKGTGPYMDRLNEIRKIVFSASLTSADEWRNTEIVATDAAEAVAGLTKQGDGHLMMYGYGRLAQHLAERGLVDELNLAVHPILLGAGEPMLRAGTTTHLTLVSAEARPNGVVDLRYIPKA